MPNQYEQTIDFCISLLPNITSEELKLNIKRQLQGKLIEVKREGIDQFCKENDLCPFCIKGGWECTSDHK